MDCFSSAIQQTGWILNSSSNRVYGAHGHLWCVLTHRSGIARRPCYRWEFAGCIILALFCGWVFSIFFSRIKAVWGFVVLVSLDIFWLFLTTDISRKSTCLGQILSIASGRFAIFRPSATVSRIGLMESHTCHCHWCGGPPPPQLADPPPGWLPPPTWWVVGALGLCAD